MSPSRIRRVAGAAVAAAGLLAGLAAAPGAEAATVSGAPHYTFTVHDDLGDPTFNQLLSINDDGTIAGYFGVGNADHPNRGYTLHPPYKQADFVNENFPGSVQTQVTGINDAGTTVGFYADAAGDNFGWVKRGPVWTVVIDPYTTGTVNQLLGTNDNGLAVGFYTDADNHSHGYVFNFHQDTFRPVTIPGAQNVTASGINQAGEITGFYNKPGGPTLGFVLAGRRLTSFSLDHSSSTMALGINNAGYVVGSYAGTNPADTYGFIWHAGWSETIIEPHGPTTTVVNGLNNRGDLVGFFTDAAGNTHGFEATP
jgi:uncharacterized membrane protein